MTDDDAFLLTARQVITDEANALQALCAELSGDFVSAVRLILNAKGHVIVSGIGKSGHIGRKIAATLASTGTPALFIHPAEASHGDLGMVSESDVVLVVSNSGEAPELANLLAFTRRFDIPLIGLSSCPGSALMSQADAYLLIPSMGEACGFGMVPSVSTTMSLAMGDALAIALMKHRDFRPEQFCVFHPGGKLGARLTRVSDLMHRGDALPLVEQMTPMADALLEISAKGFGVVGVKDQDGALTGIITDGDLRRHMDGLLDHVAGDVMTSGPTTIGPDALAEEAIRAMNDRKITCLFVLSDTGGGSAQGLLHIHDCLRVGLG